MNAALVLLAAGKSERMGFPKGLLEVNGETLIERQLRRFQEAGGTRLIVVLGEHADAYKAKVPDLARIGVLNPAPERGPFSSLQIGLKALGLRDAAGARDQERRLAGVFVQPVDVPPPNPAVYRALFDAMTATASAARPKLGDKHGHPVLLAAPYAATLLALDPTQSRLDVLLRELTGAAHVSVAVDDPSVLGNLNAPGDVAH